VGTFLVRAARDPRFLKSAEVAEAIGVSKVTLKTWLRDGRIPEPVRDPHNGYRLWTTQDVDTIRRMLKEGDNR
jgi:DNA-binding transcriptional MerR regulator